jgi:uncharacterized protein YggE
MKPSTFKKSILAASPVAIIALIAVVLTAPSATATTSTAGPRHITVNAEGTVKVVPDAVRINATVSAISSSSKAALAEVATTATALRAALKAAGIATKEITSQTVTVYPEYNYTNDKGSILVGYRGSQSFTIVVRNAANAGTVVDAIVAASGDNLQVNGVTPFVLDASQATESARAVAVKNARTKANSYAKLLGVKLGKISYLVENGSPSITAPTYDMPMLAKSEASATVVDLGQQDVIVTVTVRWAL